MLRGFVRGRVVAFSIRNRTRKAAVISDWMREHGCRTVLFVGTVGDHPSSANENIVEHALMREFEVVMGVDIEPRETSYPFQVADGRNLPFPEKWVDCSVANAIIEHVGSEADQRRFVAEQSRVARCWVITTPNRWFPVESHTSTLFLHWQPRWRNGRHEFTRLLSRREFVTMLPPRTEVVGKPWSATFTALWDGGPPRL